MTKHLTNALAPLELRIAAADAALAFADALTEVANARFMYGAGSEDLIAAENASSSAYTELGALTRRLATYA